jgi:hypothetical protein
MTIHEVKPMADRAKESINLIKQIRDLGIDSTEPPYIEIKKYLNMWIKSTENKIVEYDIEFARYGRKGKLTLPWKASKSCEFFLKKPFGS